MKGQWDSLIKNIDTDIGYGYNCLPVAKAKLHNVLIWNLSAKQNSLIETLNFALYSTGKGRNSKNVVLQFDRPGMLFSCLIELNFWSLVKLYAFISQIEVFQKPPAWLNTIFTFQLLSMIKRANYYLGRLGNLRPNCLQKCFSNISCEPLKCLRDILQCVAIFNHQYRRRTIYFRLSLNARNRVKPACHIFQQRSPLPAPLVLHFA